MINLFIGAVPVFFLWSVSICLWSFIACGLMKLLFFQLSISHLLVLISTVALSFTLLLSFHASLHLCEAHLELHCCMSRSIFFEAIFCARKVLMPVCHCSVGATFMLWPEKYYCNITEILLKYYCMHIPMCVA